MYSLNLTLGGDVSLSRDRTGPGTEVALRSLEPYRLFGGIAFSFDTWAQRRRQEKWEAIRASRERESLKAQAVAAAQKAHDDSIAAANAHTQINNITVQNDQLSQKAQQDSMALAAKARQDSIALADAQQKLAQERARRSDLENQLLSTGNLVMGGVYFETGKTDISINSKPYLDMLSKMLIKYPKLRIEVAGHTDNVGSDAYNMTLSQARAMSVRNYMVGQEPSLDARLTAHGYGESAPKADNRTAAGRKLNRRTELQVLNKDALREYNEPVVSSTTPAGQATGSAAASSAADSSGSAVGNAPGTATAPMGGVPAGSGTPNATPNSSGNAGADSLRSRHGMGGSLSVPSGSDRGDSTRTQSAPSNW
jgi:outer membrane protein OmpA-like peptidoglycan-associated protein